MRRSNNGYSIADDPNRPVAWRWRSAKGFDSLYYEQPTAEDEWLSRAKRFLAAANIGPYRTPRHHLRQLDAEIEGATAIRFERDPRHRALLESYVLAGETVTTVASQCGLPAYLIECYCMLFFDVQERLDDHSYIMAKAIDVQRPEDFARDYPYKLWRAIAFKGGAAMLDVLLAMSQDAIMPVPPEVPGEQAASWWPAQVAACRSLVASLVSPDAFKPAPLNQLRRHARQAAERRRAGTPDSYYQCRAAVRKMVADHKQNKPARYAK